MTNEEPPRLARLKCPRCGRSDFAPGVVICPQCKVALVHDAWPRTDEDGGALRVRLSPIIREALASRQPGEDFDEALLRALKTRHPAHASPLLPACARLIEIEAERANQNREQTISRLAQSDPGPEIVLKTSGGPQPTTTTQTTVIRVGDEEYGSLDEVPPHIRRAIEARMRGGKPRSRPGCAGMLVAGWLAALLRMAGR